MKIFSLGIIWLSLIVFATSATADAVHYVGFNKFEERSPDKSATLFDAYIVDLLPIMQRYNMKLEVYSVIHGGSEALDADVLTFGTAPDMQTFQKFFQDPDLQQIMPSLVAALSAHQVVFTAGDFMPGEASIDSLMLQLDWFEVSGKDSVAYEQLLGQYSQVADQYGVIREASTTGIMSNRGLGAEIIEIPAPQSMELWRMRNAHGFFDDLSVIQTNRQIKDLVSRGEAFWLQVRSYD